DDGLQLLGLKPCILKNGLAKNKMLPAAALGELAHDPHAARTNNDLLDLGIAKQHRDMRRYEFEGLPRRSPLSFDQARLRKICGWLKLIPQTIGQRVIVGARGTRENDDAAADRRQLTLKRYVEPELRQAPECKGIWNKRDTISAPMRGSFDL